MNAVLLGYGTVGKGVEILCKNRNDLHLKQVFVRPNKTKLPYFSSDGVAMVTDPEIDIVFECLSGIEPANTLITLALEHGKHVITSNKAVVSYNLERYCQLAKRYNGSIQIEACVAGGIPFLDAILKLSKLEDINGYEGIFNGTSNYILDQIQKHDISLDEALKKAQNLGYAETDPTNDIEGIDVFYKANITNMLAFQTYSNMLHSPIGITKITKDDIRLAKEYKKVIRHIAISSQKGNEYATVIAPAFLPEDHFLSSVHDNYNAQFIYADSFDKLGYFGQGAGQLATAQAMLANAIDTLSNREREIFLNHKKTNTPELLSFDWIIRTEKDIQATFNVEPLKDSYYICKNKNILYIDEIIKFDENALIALWRN